MNDLKTTLGVLDTQLIKVQNDNGQVFTNKEY